MTIHFQRCNLYKGMVNDFMVLVRNTKVQFLLHKRYSGNQIETAYKFPVEIDLIPNNIKN